MNLLLSAVYLLITFFLTCLFYKKFGRVGLIAWMIMTSIVCNVQTVKTIEVLGFTSSLGNIAYGAIFLATDILSEKYGENEAKKGIIISLLCQLIFMLLIFIVLQYNPSEFDTSDDAFHIVFNLLPRITIGSLVACFVSSMLDARLYSVLKRKSKRLWLRNNLSTMVSQTIDTAIFCMIAFLGAMPIAEVLEIAGSMLLFKLLIAVFDTRFIYAATKFKNVKEA